jgi:hypothetical protein
MLGEEEGLFRDLTGRSSGWWSDGFDRAVSSGSSSDLSSDERILAQEKPKERRRIDVAADDEAPITFYRADEGGEMVP